MYDVIVVGAGIGGIYAVHRFAQQGLSVAGVEGAPGVGGVWYHNRYPGARVDLEGIYYSYFDPELYRRWTWKERYPSQPELLAYLNFAADTWDVKRHFRFNTWVTGATFDPATDRYVVTTDTGLTLECRFLVMATGPLSAARQPDFPGLDEYRGETLLTAHWPDHPVDVAGKRVGVIGTSATGVQVIPVLAPQASHLYVFQRTANYSVPAHNGPMDPQRHEEHVARIDELTHQCLHHPGGTDLPLADGPAASFSPAERTALLERRWAYGGHAMGTVFTDQGTDVATNELVAEFVRQKIRTVVARPDVADKLIPTAYPIGTRRLCVDTNYYQTFNRDNVTLVDIREDPIECFTATGVRTRAAHYDLDLVVFATGFKPFTGSLFKANIRAADGTGLSDLWARGPVTYLGLQVRGLPNLFIVNGPGSPSVLANFFPTTMQQSAFIGDLIAHMAAHNHTRVEPTEQAQREWTAHVAEMAAPMLRYKTPNYMVHVNDDGSRAFIPYPGGFDRHARKCAEVEANGYEGFAFS
ncbi:flavin-containing monooxygenase [Phytohabitans kaempferiae]|uniref:Flavin-containing monooxygenase n=1 Tax=Phytohabitans kaempferiae TaxID=1620943 RepID=A0ABV6LYA9_9ACTN